MIDNVSNSSGDSINNAVVNISNGTAGIIDQPNTTLETVTENGQNLVTEVLSSLQTITNDLIEQVVSSTNTVLQQGGGLVNEIAGQINDGAQNIPAVTNNLLNQVVDTTNQVINNLNVNIGDVNANVFQPLVSEVNSSLDTVNNTLNHPDGVAMPVIDIVNTAIYDANVNLDIINNQIIQPVNENLSGLNDALDQSDMLPVLGGTNGQDTDLSGALLGQNASQSLDPLEALVGDVDTAFGASLEILSPGGTDNNTGDHDLTLGNDIDLINHDIAGVEQSLTLDPIESVLGDIDIDLTSGVNVLGQVADPLIDNAAGGENVILAPVLNSALDTLGLSPIVNPAIDQAGHTLSSSLDSLIGDGNHAPAGDTDIVIGDNINLMNQNLTQGGINLDLNPVEDIVGDIDINLDLNIGVLNPSATTQSSSGTVVNVLADAGLVDHNLASTLQQIGANDPVLNSILNGAGSLTVSTDVLGMQAAPVLDAANGGTGQQTLFSQVGSGLSNFVDSVISQHNTGGATAGAIADLTTSADLGWTNNSPATISHTGTSSVIADSIGSVIPDPVHTVSSGLSNLLSGHSDNHHPLHGLFG